MKTVLKIEFNVEFQFQVILEPDDNNIKLAAESIINGIGMQANNISKESKYYLPKLDFETSKH